MKILAIDPGSVFAGFAVCELQGRKMHYITSGVLKFNAKDDFLERIKFIYEESLRLLTEHQPDEIAVEGLIYVKSPTSLMKLAQARGAMLAALTQTGCPVHEYAPTAVKATVAGHGGTDKEGMQKLLRLHMGPIEFKTHDESDAVAIAFCHMLHKTSAVPMMPQKKSPKKGKGLAASLAHRVKEMN
ncbi:MAG: crossover junction endodeoxyribonuclease RuvC [Bacteriovoracaceae bacterium]|nr:crossover junction endodeoxyribonuclease RuvC [Bacteriovoracaceae bacterium]